MKLLLDANISWSLVKKLQIRYPETIHVNQTGLQMPAEDKAILEFAKRLNFVFLTFDDDYINLSIKSNSPPKVIILKTLDQTEYAIMNVLSFLQGDIEGFYKSTEESILQIFPSKKM